MSLHDRDIFYSQSEEVCPGNFILSEHDITRGVAA